MVDDRTKPDTARRPDPLQERLRDPVYARAFEEYRTELIERAEASIRPRRRPIRGRGPAAPREAVHLQPRGPRRESEPVLRIPEK